jgi:hypothetical protein
MIARDLAQLAFCLAPRGFCPSPGTCRPRRRRGYGREVASTVDPDVSPTPSCILVARALHGLVRPLWIVLLLKGFPEIPSTLLGLIAIASVLLLMLRPRIGAIIAALGLTAIAAAVLSPLGNVLLTPLEQRFPMWSYPPQEDWTGSSFSAAHMTR